MMFVSKITNNSIHTVNGFITLFFGNSVPIFCCNKIFQVSLGIINPFVMFVQFFVVHICFSFRNLFFTGHGDEKSHQGSSYLQQVVSCSHAHKQLGAGQACLLPCIALPRKRKSPLVFLRREVLGLFVFIAFLSFSVKEFIAGFCNRFQ